MDRRGDTVAATDSGRVQDGWTQVVSTDGEQQKWGMTSAAATLKIMSVDTLTGPGVVRCGGVGVEAVLGKRGATAAAFGASGMACLATFRNALVTDGTGEGQG